jgi:hypothetical protein
MSDETTVDVQDVSEGQRRYCQDCRWFEDGAGFYVPTDRCSNPLAVLAGQRSLVRRQSRVECVRARSPNSVCGLSGELFQARLPLLNLPKNGAIRRIWKLLFG